MHVSEEARKAWEKAQRETKRKPPCPACDKLNETMGAAAAGPARLDFVDAPHIILLCRPPA